MVPSLQDSLTISSMNEYIHGGSLGNDLQQKQRRLIAFGGHIYEEDDEIT